MGLAQRKSVGFANFHAGFAAEHMIARHYHARGLEIVARRWRGQGGEIDLVARSKEGFVFIEVKSGRKLSMAAFRLNERQKARLYQAAEEFLSLQHEGLGASARFDVALVGHAGEFDVIENALMFG